MAAWQPREVVKFLCRYVRCRAGTQHTSFALVESVRTDAGPRQHVVAYLGGLNTDQEPRWRRVELRHFQEELRPAGRR